MSDNVIIVDYNPQWPLIFEKEKASILAIAGEHIEDIQHVGSTAVPGLAAKPIVDIMIAVYNLSLVEKCVELIASLNYGYLGEFGIPERHFFRKPPSDDWQERAHNIHMVLKGSNQWENQTRFRDYLRTHPETRQAYQDLKRALAKRFVNDRNGYTDAKQDFIFATLRKAGYRDIRDI
jgi:GrpB-like predicted nucleotidyltransferase (UPF0157 family)